MSGWLIFALAYAGVWLAIQIVARIALRSEPTAHGQMVGRQAAFWIGMVWLPFLIWMVFVGLAMGAHWLVKRARGAR